jgi:hypothetical protein
MIQVSARSSIPEIPRQQPETHLQPPMVFVQAAWEYKDLVRTLPSESPLSEAELNTLGGIGWELVAVYSEGASLHFCFKRLVR